MAPPDRDSWTVTEITPTEVVLQSGDQRGKVKLLYGASPPTAEAATPPETGAAPGTPPK